MTHKQKCIEYCKGHLSTLTLTEIFSTNLFDSYYRKHNGSNANPYTFGLHAADFIITNTKKEKELL